MLVENYHQFPSSLNFGSSTQFFAPVRGQSSNQCYTVRKRTIVYSFVLYRPFAGNIALSLRAFLVIFDQNAVILVSVQGFRRCLLRVFGGRAMVFFFLSVFDFPGTSAPAVRRIEVLFHCIRSPLYCRL